MLRSPSSSSRKRTLAAGSNKNTPSSDKDAVDGSFAGAGSSHGLAKKPRRTATGSTVLSSLAQPPTVVDRLEVKALESELEHERSLRVLDCRKLQQNVSRLERQVEFLNLELKEAKRASGEMEASAAKDLEKMKKSHQLALRALKDELEEQWRMQCDSPEEEIGQALEEQVQQNDMLQGRYEAAMTQVESLKKELLKHQEQAMLVSSSKTTPVKDSSAGKDIEASLSPAPASLLKELNRLRLALADQERQNRQLELKRSLLQSRADQMIENREKAKSAQMRVEQLQLQLQKERQRNADLQANVEAFAEFQTQLSQVLPSAISSTGETSTQPEITTVIRHLRKADQRAHEAEEVSRRKERECQESNKRASSLEKDLNSKKNQEVLLEQQLAELKQLCKSAATEVAQVRAQEKNWQREADSLRALIRTYEEPPDKSATSKIATGDDSNSRGERYLSSSTCVPTVQGLELSLTSAREQLAMVTQEKETILATLQKELESARQTNRDQQSEHERVLAKFEKLKQALLGERAKASQAEERAIKAETLAGKGSFNPDTTKVLHIEENPLLCATRKKYQEQIDTLKLQLHHAEESSSGTGGSKAATTAAVSTVDAQKLHQRLKESFKEQIALFREGVYLLTGYKVDMTVMERSDRPRFKVRSMYSEREEDHLLFHWPKADTAGDGVSSLDLMDTPWAQVLTKTESFQYMTKFDSLPAFLASTQLHLFETQTFA